ncbi:hypothetical protein [Flammeovirga pacifica]|uniref:Uncharacterized protein n=1 Tax=Flammeovirga pacifica TaxID=915059 RepID=A0A1S1YWR4_FLAPC|nr:hypothetical protein [Flammeovirga pacifica]OHX65457.1 hypothetical protein NH26_03385 [Flammeovirga pacifica]
MVLSKGISGFDSFDNNKIEEELWKQSIQSFFSVKAEINFSERYSYNYHIIEYQNSLYLLLKNKYSDFYAVAEVIDDEEEYHKIPKHRFINHSEIVSFLDAMGFQSIEEKLLSLNIDTANPLITSLLQNLSKDELKQFSKKKPQNIAQIVFNDWKK